MPDNHKLRLHIEYRALYVADLRIIVRAFESAYNILQRADQPNGRMRRADQLTVQTVRTGNSLTLVLLGGAGIATLGRLFATREGFWKSEKIKWEAKSAKWVAKSAELDYGEKVRLVQEAKIAQVEAKLDRKRDPEGESAKLMGKLSKFVDKSREIRSIDVEIDGEDTDPKQPRALILPEGRRFR
jgi:hypothetical protein